MRRRHLAWIALVAKLAITLGLLAWLLSRVQLAPVLAQIRAMSPVAAIGAELLMLVQLVLLSVRWQLVSTVVDAPLTAAKALRLSAIGHFFNQVLPSGFAGDAVRAWLASREGLELGRLVRGILCDRVVGLLALIVLVAVTLFVWPGLATDALPGSRIFRITAFICLGALAALFMFGAPAAGLLMRHRYTQSSGKLMRDLHGALYSGATSAAIVALAAAVQLLSVAAICVCAKGMNIDLEFRDALTVIPAIMLVSLAPFSFAGWGVREGAMVVGLGLSGIAATDALALSVAYGLLQIALGVPGGALWLARRAAPRPAPPDNRS